MTTEGSRQLGVPPPPDAKEAFGASARPPRRQKKLGRRFTLLSVESAGRSYTVWKARDDKNGQTVAVKVPVLSGDTDGPEPMVDACARLRHESNILARLDHPAIVRRWASAGLRAQPPYLVMEYLDGCTLVRNDRFTPVEAVRILLPIVDALAHAHRRGILHRDIKPENVVCARGPDGQVLPKLIDFELSTSQLSTNVADSPDCVYGTVGYMPLEQLFGRTLDARADVWSLCVTLYELVRGRQAFPGETDASAMAATMSVDPPTLDKLGVADPELASIVSKGMKRSKDARWADMHELGAVLASWLLGAGVDVDPYGAPVAHWLSSRGVQRVGGTGLTGRTSISVP